MRRYAMTLAALLLGAAPLAACGGSGGAAGQSVPSLGQGAGQSGTGQGSGSARAAALHTAARCFREHGIPAYADPALTPDGTVYTDQRSLQNASAAALSAVRQACGGLAARAGLNPESEPPAPPRLVAAGVRAAQCLRAHGLVNDQDPNAQSPYTPGHGFGFTAGEIPAGGKTSPAFQQATHACRGLLDAEIRASTLASLGNGG